MTDAVLRLPPELQARCLACVSAGERVETVARVCRAWRRLVFGSSLLWDRVGLWLAAGQTMRSGRYHTLLEQLRCMGETTAKLELMLSRACTRAGRYSSASWMSFVLQELLAAFPRLRSLRLIQLPSVSVDCSGGVPAPGLTPAQLDALCQSCTNLVELGLNPVRGDDGQLGATVARLQQLPYLRRLLLAIDFDTSVPPRTSLQCLSCLTKLSELRCAVDNTWRPSVPVSADMTVSGLVNLQALELAGVRWHETSGPGQGLSLPPSLTRLSLRAPSWGVLLPMLTGLALHSLSVWCEGEPKGYDLGSVTCLTQLTQLQIVTAVGVRSNPAPFGGGLVLPAVQRLKLCWVQYTETLRAFPPEFDADSLGSLTYLCLHFVKQYQRDEFAYSGQLDFRPLSILKTLVLQAGMHPWFSAMRVPSSLTGLQLEYPQVWMPGHLVEATGLRCLVLLHCPHFKYRNHLMDATAVLSKLTSLVSFYCCVTRGKRSVTGECFPGTEKVRDAREVKLEGKFHRSMPWLEQGACVVHWSDVGGSGRRAACLRQHGEADNLENLLRVHRWRREYTPDWL